MTDLRVNGSTQSVYRNPANIVFKSSSEPTDQVREISILTWDVDDQGGETSSNGNTKLSVLLRKVIATVTNGTLNLLASSIKLII